MKKVFAFLSATLLLSCQENLIKQEKGGIDIISNFYFNASKGLNDSKSIVVSKLNYQGNDIIEFVPNMEYPEITENTFFIKDSLYFDLTDISRVKPKVKG